MIYGVGTDLVSIDRIKGSIEKFGRSFVEKICSQIECDSLNLNGEFSEKYFSKLAKMFSMKESVAKAFGTGIGAKISLKDVSLLRDENGKPYVELSGAALETALQIVDENGGDDFNFQVSLSDEVGLVQTFAVFEIL